MHSLQTEAFKHTVVAFLCPPAPEDAEISSRLSQSQNTSLQHVYSQPFLALVFP